MLQESYLPALLAIAIRSPTPGAYYILIVRVFTSALLFDVKQSALISQLKATYDISSLIRLRAQLVFLLTR